MLAVRFFFFFKKKIMASRSIPLNHVYLNCQQFCLFLYFWFNSKGWKKKKFIFIFFLTQFLFVKSAYAFKMNLETPSSSVPLNAYSNLKEQEILALLTTECANANTRLAEIDVSKRRFIARALIWKRYQKSLYYE